MSGATSPRPTGRTLAERISVALSPRDAGRPRRTAARQQAKNSIVSSLVGASLALGGLGLALGQPQVFDRIGEALVEFMTDGDALEQLVDEPAAPPAKDGPAKERQSE